MNMWRLTWTTLCSFLVFRPVDICNDLFLGNALLAAYFTLNRAVTSTGLNAVASEPCLIARRGKAALIKPATCNGLISLSSNLCAETMPFLNYTIQDLKGI